MSEQKAIEKFFGSNPPANIQAHAAALHKLAATRRNTGNKLFLKFTKTGEWLYGSDEEAADGELWAVNPASFCYGVIGWENGNVAGEFSSPIGAAPSWTDSDLTPIRSTKQGDGWKDSLGIELRGMDSGREVIFKTTSLGGKNAIAELAEKVGEQLDADAAHPVAVVSLQKSSYMHRSYGKIYNPLLEISVWADMDGKHADAVKALPKRKLI